MIKIFKYELHKTPIVGPIMQVLDVQLQGGIPVMWALVNTETNIKKVVDVQMLWTGQVVPEDIMKEYTYMKTLQDNEGLVWHVFIKGV